MSEPHPCAVCGKPQATAYRPFCSKHCADVDLQRWFSGRYAVPVLEEDEDEQGLGRSGSRAAD